MPIVVHIEYSLRNPVDGIQFVLPTDAYPFVSTVPVVGTALLMPHSVFLTRLPPPLRRTRRGVGCRVLTTYGRNAHGSLSLWFLGTWKNQTQLSEAITVISVSRRIPPPPSSYAQEIS